MKKYEVSRREFINMAAGAAVGASGLLGGRAVQAAEGETLRINVPLTWRYFGIGWYSW